MKVTKKLFLDMANFSFLAKSPSPPFPFEAWHPAPEIGYYDCGLLFNEYGLWCYLQTVAALFGEAFGSRVEFRLYTAGDGELLRLVPGYDPKRMPYVLSACYPEVRGYDAHRFGWWPVPGNLDSYSRQLALYLYKTLESLYSHAVMDSQRWSEPELAGWCGKGCPCYTAGCVRMRGRAGSCGVLRKVDGGDTWRPRVPFPWLEFLPEDLIGITDTVTVWDKFLAMQRGRGAI